MIPVATYHEDSVLIEFDSTTPAKDVLDALKPFVRDHPGRYQLVYLPPGLIDGDPLPQRGYLGLRTP